MNKKIIFATIVFFIISTLSILCFAEASNNTNTSNTVDLKGEITESLDKTRNTASNLTNGVVSGASSVMNTVTNGINDMTGMNNGTNNNATTMNTTNTNNNNGNYNTTRTAVDDAYYGAGNQMDTTTWLWMILAIVAVIIVGAVWYYAMQGVNDRNDEH